MQDKAGHQNQVSYIGVRAILIFGFLTTCSVHILWSSVPTIHMHVFRVPSFCSVGDPNHPNVPPHRFRPMRKFPPRAPINTFPLQRWTRTRICGKGSAAWWRLRLRSSSGIRDHDDSWERRIRTSMRSSRASQSLSNASQSWRRSANSTSQLRMRQIWISRWGGTPSFRDPGFLFKARGSKSKETTTWR